MTTRKKKKEKVSEERVRVVKTNYPKPLKSDSYRATYDCTNCGYRGDITFKKGKVAPAVTMCPKCECASAKKSLPYVRGPVAVPLPKHPGIGPEIPPIPPWPREQPKPWPSPDPYDPWNVPHKPYKPWDTPLQPYMHRQYTGIDEVENDIDNSRVDEILIDDSHEGLGLMPRIRENFRAHACGDE